MYRNAKDEIRMGVNFGVVSRLIRGAIHGMDAQHPRAHSCTVTTRRLKRCWRVAANASYTGVYPHPTAGITLLLFE